MLFTTPGVADSVSGVILFDDDPPEGGTTKGLLVEVILARQESSWHQGRPGRKPLAGPPASR